MPASATPRALPHKPSLHLVEAQVAGGGRAHLYELTWAAPANGGAMGACHALDIPLVFGTFGGLGGELIGPAHLDEAAALSGRVRAAWTSFATTGDPGWPAYDTEHRPTRILDTEPTTTTYPEETSCRLWQHHVFNALPLIAS
ncbi:hypothetical protein ACFU53_31465 [Streptomyces sp. NPDC057474]|uniref:hypothetical protein n=1 Tax=Streptomyces sp. NPDC057474 TaxID=3346144 RepID=UPI00369CFA23